MKVAAKILIIGIDGGTWEALAPACDKGWMPNLDRFRKQGCWGTLRSTLPPITPAAWTSLMTGQNPGRHGILGFQEYDHQSKQLRLTTSKSISSETLWQKLSRHGKQVAVVGVPMMYPPPVTSGVVVSGFDTPSTECEFTYPSSFKAEILKEIPEFTFHKRYRRRELKNVETFQSFLSFLSNDTRRNLKILRMGMKKARPAVAMIVIRSFDQLLHHFWKLLDSSYDTSYDPRDSLMQRYYEDLDEAVGELLELGEEKEAVVFLVSDHGGQRKLGNVYPNRILRKLGYLRAAPWWKLLVKHIEKQWFNKSIKAKRDRLWKSRFLREQVNLNKSIAYVTEKYLYAGLNLQVDGKYESGEDEQREKQKLTEEIVEALRYVVADDGEPVFELVERPSRLYGVKGVKSHFPDLMIAPRQGYMFRLNVAGSEVIVKASEEDLAGDHSLNGIFGLMGPGVIKNKKVDAEIIDIAPTILAALGLPVTDDMDGRVLTEGFQEAPKIFYESAQKQAKGPEYSHTEKEEEEIMSRLADLGYLQ